MIKLIIILLLALRATLKADAAVAAGAVESNDIGLKHIATLAAKRSVDVVEGPDLEEGFERAKRLSPGLRRRKKRYRLKRRSSTSSASSSSSSSSSPSSSSSSSSSSSASSSSKSSSSSSSSSSE